MDTASDEPDAPLPEPAAIEPVHVGGTVGPYLLLKELGRGATATVYLARTKEGTECALKVLLPRFAASGRLHRRLAREGRVLKDLAHPNLVKILDVGGPPPFVVTEYLPGATLAQAMRGKGAYDHEETAALMAQLAQGLAAAHRAGIVHRDLKPANVILTPVQGGLRAKILDFGLARALEESTHGTMLTHVSDLIGTPAYMSPEQIRDPGTVGPASDLYSLGIIGYELLLGRRPALRPSKKAALLVADLEAPPLPGDGPLEALIMRLLEVDPANRPASADEVLDALEASLPKADEMIPTIGGALSRSDTPLLAPTIVPTMATEVEVANTKITSPPSVEVLAPVMVARSSVGSPRWSRLLAAVLLFAAGGSLAGSFAISRSNAPTTVPMVELATAPEQAVAPVEVAPRVTAEPVAQAQPATDPTDVVAVERRARSPRASEPHPKRAPKPRVDDFDFESALRSALDRRGLRASDLLFAGVDAQLIDGFAAAVRDDDQALARATWGPLERSIEELEISPKLVRRRLESIRASLGTIAKEAGPERAGPLEAAYFQLRGDLRDDSDPQTCQRILFEVNALDRQLKALARAK